MNNAQQIVSAALEEGRKQLAKEMYDRVQEMANRGYGHPAYNTPENAERFIAEIRTALEEYEEAASTLVEAAWAIE